jgi:nucleotide-binding universal stress UspA family protein
MTRIASILLTLDGSPASAKGVGCALWLTQSLGATLHVLHATTHPSTLEDALARLRFPGAQRAEVVLHQVAGAPEVAVLQHIAEFDVGLVVISARGESALPGVPPARSLGRVAQAVIECCPVPVVLLPTHYRESLPWTSMLAAGSGEPAADQALQSAIQLAAELRLTVHVVHCHAQGGETAPVLGRYADAPHHEYSQRLRQMIQRGMEGCESSADCLGQTVLRQGDPASVVLDEARRLESSVVALGWHGAFGAGRAPVLKRLLDQAEFPLLLVREVQRAGARLRVGAETLASSR